MSPIPAGAREPVLTPRASYSNAECGQRSIYVCHGGIIVGIIAAVVIGVAFLVFMYRSITKGKKWREDTSYRIWRLRQSLASKRDRPKSAPPVARTVPEMEMAGGAADGAGPGNGVGVDVDSLKDRGAAAAAKEVARDTEDEITAPAPAHHQPSTTTTTTTGHHVHFGNPS